MWCRVCKDAVASLEPKNQSHQEIATDAVNSLLEVNFKPKSIKNKHYKQKHINILLEAFYDLIDFLGLIDDD